MRNIPLFILFIEIAYFTYWVWYNSTNHSACDDVAALRDNARPIDMQRKEVNSIVGRKFRTTLVFDDGFRYITHRTNINRHIFTYSISVMPSDNIDILQAGIKAHDAFMKKKGY